MRVEVESSSRLTFSDGSPVRAASAIAPLGDGWLVVQDDATHAAWLRPESVTAVRVVDPVDGLEVFSSSAGTKHLKPDFEAACAVSVNGIDGVLLLGSGSTGARMRASLVTWVRRTVRPERRNRPTPWRVWKWCTARSPVLSDCARIS